MFIALFSVGDGFLTTARLLYADGHNLFSRSSGKAIMVRMSVLSTSDEMEVNVNDVKCLGFTLRELPTYKAVHGAHCPQSFLSPIRR